MRSSRFARDRWIVWGICGAGTIAVTTAKLLNLLGIPYHPYRFLLMLGGAMATGMVVLAMTWRHRAGRGATLVLGMVAVISVALIGLEFPPVMRFGQSLLDRQFNKVLGTAQEAFSYGLISLAALGFGLLVVWSAENRARQERQKRTLEESEARLHRAVSETPFPMMVHAEDGKILEVSKSLLETTGYSLEDLATTSDWTERAHGDRKEIANAAIREQYGSLSRGHQGEFPVRTKSGERRIWDFSFSPLGRNAEGKRMVVGMATDVTDRRRMERVHSGRNAVLEMLTSGAELEEILTTIAKAGEEFSEDWRCSILLLDREAGCLRHGAVPSMPDAYNSAIDGLPIGKGVACCGTAAATGERMFIEDVMTHPYWEPYRELAKSVNIRGCWSEPILSPEREILGTFGVYLREPGLPNEAETAFIQSTGHFAGMAIERKRSAAALRRSEALFRSSVDNARSVIGCLTVEGTVTEWNLEAERVFGIAREEAIGRYYPSLRYPVEIREAVRERMEWVLQGNEIRDYETEVRHRNGSEQTLLWNISPLKDDEGKVTGMICSGQNITEYKQLQAQMQHAQKLESLGVLAGGIAHDFNNLLVGILGNADLVKAELGEDSPAAAGVDLIRRSAQRAVHLTQQMLAYAGKGQATVEQQDLSTLVKDMCDLLRISVSKNVVIREDFGVGLPAIEADASQLQQVVMNLITNASEAIGEENGVIALTTGTVKADEGFMSEAYGDSPPEPGEYVYLRVEDTGCGMDAETSAKMFDPFFTTKFTGRGLGMAAVLGIIRGHRGAIKVESEVGKGTTIWILLPKGSRAVRESVRLAAQPARVRAGRTILVVDDEETVLSVSRRVLEGAGFGVLCASNGLEGIEVFRQRQAEIDVVLLDMTMPKMGGKETLAALRKVQPDARVVLTSGYDEANVANDFENGMGRPVFLQKPFGAGRLLEVIHQALASGDGAEGVRESAAVLRN